MTTQHTQVVYLKTLARLRRVSRALSQWDEWDAADLLPPSLRPTVTQPLLDRARLRSLRFMLLDQLAELEARYQRG